MINVNGALMAITMKNCIVMIYMESYRIKNYIDIDLWRMHYICIEFGLKLCFAKVGKGVL